MATVSIGTLQSAWNKKVVTTKSGGVAARGSYAHSVSMWAESSPSTDGIFVIDLSSVEANSLALMFYGTQSESGNPRNASARIWLVSKVTTGGTDNYLAHCVGDLDIILGTTTASSGLFSGATHYFASDIKISDDRSLQPPAMRVVAPDGTLGIALVLLDSIGASAVIVSMSTVTSSKASGIGLCSRAL